MFSLFNFSSIFPRGSADPICPYVRTPMNTQLQRLQQGRLNQLAQWARAQGPGFFLRGPQLAVVK